MSELSAALPSLPFSPVEVCDGIHAAVAFEVIRDLYGLQAATIAAWCAIEARTQGDEVRYRFWFGVFCDLRKDSPVFSLMLPTALKSGPPLPGETDLPSADGRRGDVDRLLHSNDIGSFIIREIRSIIEN
ncbi:hypothetical protein FY133_24335 (plasmid) [Agrobacterium tumefaciens]|uniref:Uncharacterized protein n=1 Tax=Agrobacterium tumefaciens TaxID=358 RepID=A0AAP9EAD8_AGRTU|nr:hypothetical protein [Agrobacterium tumefaciens]NSZ61159.1 hypothetical protein [Agrobacterium tumefaciens]QDY97572.1 hypothetical protein CG010_025740 [Agrobacterium tumefaciens]UXS12699.1 hypothetical protein FY155_23885 [Agrobacterium tumefaciens]UXS20061.1 hypothetical protein FY154_23880 [Agrobacterium tumefaciens]UXS27709.1 hypothetical protein FY153_24725 [Agrobacterium tumefaciens]